MARMGEANSVSEPTKKASASARAHARELANSVVLSRLNAKLSSEPDSDLGEILKQQSASYSRLVQDLISMQPEPSDGDRSCRTPEAPSEPAPQAVEPPYILANDSGDITHALSDQLMALLVSEGSAVEERTSSKHQLPHVLGDALNRLLRRGEVLHSLHQNWVIAIGKNEAVKIGSSIDPDHMNNLQYINEHVPDIPTPEFHGALRSGRLTYVFLSRARGVSLEIVWPDLTKAQKLSVQQQLTTSFQVLRAKSCQDERLQLGSFETGICKDTRRMQRVSVEPLCNEADFNDFLCRAENRTPSAWISMVRSFLKEDHRILMTHGDLHPRNIMVVLAEDGGGENIQVSSILDWELAGWYPEHWEFVRALSTIGVRGPLRDWIDYLPTEAIGKYPVEYSLDCLIDRWLG